MAKIERSLDNDQVFFILSLSLSDSFIIFSFLYPKEILKLMKSFYICLKYSEDSLKKKKLKEYFFS